MVMSVCRFSSVEPSDSSDVILECELLLYDAMEPRKRLPNVSDEPPASVLRIP
jgi:hypothetical protein